ncbi:hypothetical protein E2I00_019077, partial [Balaenoptera physalus]
GVSLLTSPVEKQLIQKKSESPGKTACTGESNSPPGTIQGGKGLQGKSQFRTIAPKLAPQVLAPRVLPGPAPSLSDHAHPGPSLGSKALGMPPQNYALMQVAGQEGTFSLVALPHVASAQPLQKPRLPLPKNLKLPIPRYQRPGHSKGARKKPGFSSSDRGSLSTPEEPSAERGLPKSSGRAGVAGKKPSRKPAVSRGELREQSCEPFVARRYWKRGSGKVPILPYSRTRASQVYKGGAAVNLADVSLPELGAAGDKTSSVPEGFCSAPQVADRGPAPQASRQSPCDRAYCPATKADLNHKTKPNGGAAKRRGRKRKVPDELLTFQGKRKKCVINKCKDGKERAKADPQESRDQKPGAVKKYRSIMPKPVLVLPALAPLASPAATNGFSGLKKPWHGCHPGDLLRTRKQTARGMEGPVDRETKSSLEEDLLLNQADEVKFQIRCGRCQITAQSFAEIKFHLLYVHGEEIQGQLQEEISPSPGSRGAQGELVPQAAPFWKHPERRKQLKHRPLDGELCAVPRLKKQLYLRHQNDVEILAKHEGAQPGPSEPGGHPQGSEGREGPEGPEGPGPDAALSPPRPGFNCVLCAQTLGRREELLLHWEEQHKCEDPPTLWTLLSALSSQGAVQRSGESGK